MIGGAGLSAPLQFVSLVAGPGPTPSSSDPASRNPYADEAPPAAPAGGKNAPSPAWVNSEGESEKPRDQSQGTKVDGEPLSEEEERQVRKLKETDAKVRAHEQAHAIAGGPHAGAPKYEYTTGPDGKRYATSGEVAIDSSPEEGDPEATIRKMDVVIRAALAPADPSPQDLQVAREAQTERMKAQVELFKQRQAEQQERSGGDSDGASTGNSSPSPERFLRDALAAYQRAERSDDDASAFALIASA